MSTPMTKEQKEWIDTASYEALLSKWRFAPVGDPMFTGESGDYYGKVLGAKRDEDLDRHVATSKMLGWKK